MRGAQPLTIDRTLTQAERWMANARAARAWLDALPKPPVQLSFDFDGEDDDDDCETCDGFGVVDCEECDGEGCDACDGEGTIDCAECAGDDLRCDED